MIFVAAYFFVIFVIFCYQKQIDESEDSWEAVCSLELLVHAGDWGQHTSAETYILSVSKSC